ncbi:hypothetical protein BKA65DRAFT_562060 [Rhexocercosporidium sp. MPI-PUGE-AT-0058]|nr:hypothetical protein BKA65DRAFT_562060 [Rhexocercosporidium sp. MPI-PUGE-AT-0058]
MKALFTLLAGLVCFVSLIQAEDSTALSLPNCAVLCFSSTIQNSTCTATMNISATVCGAPVRDRSKSFDAITIIFGSLSLVAVILRVISRHWFNFSLGLDDVFIVGIVVGLFPNECSRIMKPTIFQLLNFSICAINIYGLSANGFGRDVWTVPFQQITNVIRYSYVVQVMYFALIPLIKISILLFYLRLFVEPTIRKLVYMTIIANVVVGVIYVILNVFQCWPISYYWTEWDGEHVGRCINVVAIVNSYSGISIGVDIWMLILPATRVARLNMQWKKKIAVAIMFSVGILFTAVSAIQLAVILPIPYAVTQNPTWDYYNSGVWSQVELSVGIICACMPSMRALLESCFSRLSSSKLETKNRSLLKARDSEVPELKSGSPDRVGNSWDSFDFDFAITQSVGHQIS